MKEEKKNIANEPMEPTPNVPLPDTSLPPCSCTQVAIYQIIVNTANV